MYRIQKHKKKAISKPCEVIGLEIHMKTVTPIFRIFNVEKAKEFYIDFLEFKVDWEHRYEPDLPL